MLLRSQIRFAHKFAAPPSPNLNRIQQAVYKTLKPIQFNIKNNAQMGSHLYDEWFVGVICSPRFEGKSFNQINLMVANTMKLAGVDPIRCRFRCQPPSRHHMLKRDIAKRWPLDK